VIVVIIKVGDDNNSDDDDNITIKADKVRYSLILFLI